MVLAATLLAGLRLGADDKDREAKEKRLADAFAELLDVIAKDPTEMTDEEAEARDRRGQELEEEAGALVKELGLEGPEGETAIEKLLEKHRPDAAARKRVMDEERRESECLSSLKRIAMALMDREAAKGMFPDALETLVKEGDIEEASTLRCPIHEGTYGYAKPGKTSETPNDRLMLWCQKAHATGRRCFSTFSGSCQAVVEGAFGRIAKAGRIEGAAHRIVVESVEVLPQDRRRVLKMRVKATGLFPAPKGKPRGSMRAEVMLDRKEGQIPGVTKFAEAAEGTWDATFVFEIPLPLEGGYPFVVLRATDETSLLMVEHSIRDAGRGGK